MLRAFAAVTLLAVAGLAPAATTVRLPAGMCAADDTIFWNGFEVPTVPSDPSSGHGGQTGDVTGTINVAGIGATEYMLHVPVGYADNGPVPLVFALHGAAGSNALAQTAASAVRNAWAGLADSEPFIVVAPVGNGSQGSWIPPPGISDYDSFTAIIGAVEAAYDIDRARIYLWGFSAGGHVAWDLAFNGGLWPTPLDGDALAGMAVSAGVQAGVACNAIDYPTRVADCDALVAAQPRQLPIDIHIGASDPLLPYAQADRTRLLAHGWHLGTTLGYHEFNGGHTYTTAHLAEAWADLCRYARGP